MTDNTEQQANCNICAMRDGTPDQEIPVHFHPKPKTEQQAVGGEELRSLVTKQIAEQLGVPIDLVEMAPDGQRQVEAWMQLISRHYIAKEAVNPFTYVEPCEPECSPERHAYHQGQWDLANRMRQSLGVGSGRLVSLQALNLDSGTEAKR